MARFLIFMAVILLIAGVMLGSDILTYIGAGILAFGVFIIAGVLLFIFLLVVGFIALSMIADRNR